MNKFILQSYEDIGSEFDDDDVEKLSEYLNNKIGNFKSFNKYDNFLIEFPTIDIQIDQNGEYDIVNSYYPKIHSKIFDLIESIEELKDCVINYYTNSQKIEVVGAEFKSVMNIRVFDFINCEIYSGIFNNCNLINCDITNSHIEKSTVEKSNVKKSKIISSNAEVSLLDNCFFMGGYMNSNMEGGIFRSGRIGPYGTLSSSTKVVTDKNNFFKVKYNDEDVNKNGETKNIKFK